MDSSGRGLRKFKPEEDKKIRIVWDRSRNQNWTMVDNKLPVFRSIGGIFLAVLLTNGLQERDRKKKKNHLVTKRHMSLGTKLEFLSLSRYISSVDR